MSFAQVFVNGRPGEAFQRWEDAPHPGVFTSFRALVGDDDVYILGLPFHYERLVHGCQRFGLLVPSLENITFEVHRGMEGLELREARIRVELFHQLYIIRIGPIDPLEISSPSIALRSRRVSRPYEDLKSSYGAALSEQCQLECPPLCETLYVDQNDCMIEGAWSNLGWIDLEGSIFFTGRGLDGVTQRVLRGLFSNIGRQVRIESTTLKDLRNRRVSPFILSALRGVVLVSEIDAVPFCASEGVSEIQRIYVEAAHLRRL